MGDSQPLLFTDELLQRARAVPEDRRCLLHRWALFPGEHRAIARRQLETAAQLVPEPQLRRVLRPLWGDDDRKVMAAAGVLLLAKVLRDHGWTVEYEPELDGLTPDLRIQKRDASFLVEARHVAGDFGLPPGYGRVRIALRGITTRTPAHFSRLEVDGRASLKGFRAFMRRTLREPPCGHVVYEEPGVRISFELHQPPLDFAVSAFLGYTFPGTRFDDRASVRAALDEKLKKYPFPLVVALQGIDTGDIFIAAEQEMYGSEVYQIPISHTSGRAAGPARMARKDDSVGMRPDSDGERVRSRLDALLPFEIPLSDAGFAVRARLFANPARPDLPGLREFLPIPSVLPLDASSMGYMRADGSPLGGKEQIRDAFTP